MLREDAHPLLRDLDEPLRATTALGVRIPHSAGEIALSLEPIEG
jgi:hypothetical protein